MRYELSDYEWTAIKPMLPNKPRGVSCLWRRLDQGAGSPARSMGEHFAETKSQRPDLL